MAKRVLVIVANGYEDMETVVPVDVLTRADVEVTIAGLEKGPVKGAYGSTIVPDTTLDRIDGLYDALVLPGGVDNAERLAAHPGVVKQVHAHNDAGKLVCAICASPALVLAEAAGILDGRKATGYPDFSNKLAAYGAVVTDQVVTVDGNIITGMGPGAALPFALAVAGYLVGAEIPDGMAQRWRITY
ncbi:MAG TPA: DJ-1 family glyoxalase III [Acidobacteriota bacterium]|nr:DJ-1 family glyoxalase III [Acidobacteriota bacterium]